MFHKQAVAIVAFGFVDVPDRFYPFQQGFCVQIVTVPFDVHSVLFLGGTRKMFAKRYAAFSRLPV
jgi:hypothetical protein